MIGNNTIAVSYSNEQLRILVEEYITQRRSAFTLKGICDYVLYWALEDGKVANNLGPLCESNELQLADQERIRHILDVIIRDGRISAGDHEAYRKL